MVKKILGNRLYLSLVGVIAVFFVAVAYIFGAVLDQPLTSRPVSVSVQLPQTGGLFEGSSVTYRGVKVGKVTDVVPDAAGVRATISLTSDTKVPKDSVARVRSLSPVGEQYLDFQPRADKGPFLASGDVVPASSTDLPKSLSSTVVAVNNLLSQIDDKKLRIVLEELSTGLNGTGDALGQILDQGGALIETLNQVWPQTDRLITNAEPALGVVTGEADSLRTFARSSKQFAQFLKDYDPELRRTLKRSPAQIQQLIALVQDADRVLPGFLATGVSFTDIFRSYDPHLRALLQAYQPGLGSLLDKIRGGELRIELIPKKQPESGRCLNYGISRLNPKVDERRPLQKGGQCGVLPELQRGAANAPGPVR